MFYAEEDVKVKNMTFIYSNSKHEIEIEIDLTDTIQYLDAAEEDIFYYFLKVSSLYTHSFLRGEIIEKELMDIIFESNVQRRQDCISKIETNDIGMNKFKSVPFEVQQNLSITQSEKLLTDYVLSDQVTNFTSDKIIVVGVPQKNSEYKNNSAVIKSLIFSLAFSLTIFAFNMLLIIFKEN